MGVPTVTLPGEIFASRHSASHLSNAGFSEWVARDEADYIAMAIRRASDPRGLALSRETMRDQVRELQKLVLETGGVAAPGVALIEQLADAAH